MKKFLCLFIISLFVFIGKIGAYVSYKVGESVSYNGISFYVIKDSDGNSDKLTLLKKEPIKSREISDFVSSTEVASKIKLTSEYASMPYYSNDACISAGDLSKCSNDYNVSDIKQVVDAWTNSYIKGNDLVMDDKNYKSRLITVDEISAIAHVERNDTPSDVNYTILDNGDWLYYHRYNYWTMTSIGDSLAKVYDVESSGVISNRDVYSNYSIRPVITIRKDSIDGYDKIVEYNKIKFYIVKDDEKNGLISLLKASPIESDEVKNFLGSSEIANKVNLNGKYVAIPYYSYGDCVSAGSGSDCKTDYELSDVKQVVDIWSSNYIKESDLAKDSSGYSARLITFDELVNNFGYNKAVSKVSNYIVNPEYTPSWIYLYSYFTMSPCDDSSDKIWNIGNLGNLQRFELYSPDYIRPVVTLKRSAIVDNNEIINNSNSDNEKTIDKDTNKNTTSKNSDIVVVPDTLQKISVISIMLGVIVISISFVIMIRKINCSKK